jgi:DNA-binding SARP family transcriptional activator
MSRLRMQVLGGLLLAGGGRTLHIANSCRPVLGYLLTHRQRNVSRVELAENLWADQHGEQARRCLSTALWRLKRSLHQGQGLIALHGEDVSFDWATPLWVDCVAFERRFAPLVRREPHALTVSDLARLERGARLYQGDYLAGMDHDWAWLERQRLRNLYCDGLYLLVAGHAAAERWSQVLRWARCLARAEPLREDVHRYLMLAHARTGNRASAIAQYRECERVLAAELNVPPMPETQQLFQDIAHASAIGLPPPAANPTHPLDDVRRRIRRVRKVLSTSERQLDKALEALTAQRKPTR